MIRLVGGEASGGPEVDLSSVLIRGENVFDAAVGDELVLLDTNYTYHGLDPIGARIWGLIDGALSVAEICAALGAEFEVDTATCARDVLSFLRDLADQQLVLVR